MQSSHNDKEKHSNEEPPLAAVSFNTLERRFGVTLKVTWQRPASLNAAMAGSFLLKIASADIANIFAGRPAIRPENWARDLIDEDIATEIRDRMQRSGADAWGELSPETRSLLQSPYTTLPPSYPAQGGGVGR